MSCALPGSGPGEQRGQVRVTAQSPRQTAQTAEVCACVCVCRCVWPTRLARASWESSRKKAKQLVKSDRGLRGRTGRTERQNVREIRFGCEGVNPSTQHVYSKVNYVIFWRFEEETASVIFFMLLFDQFAKKKTTKMTLLPLLGCQ